MAKKIFITGTGTDIGKTVIMRALTRVFINKNIKTVAIKPVESGVPVNNGTPSPLDATALRNAAGSTISPVKLCRYMFSDPVSPHLAARNENRIIEPEEIISFINSFNDSTDLLLIEGAGGLLVPLSDTLLYADLITQIDCHVIIVAPDTLGTINTTLLTIEAAKLRGLKISGIILNKGPNTILGNAEAIEQHGKIPVLGYFPEITGSDNRLAIAAETSLDLDRIYKI